MQSYDITANTPKPKWYKIRHRLSNFFLRLAKKCYPENPEVRAFLVKQFTDALIYGRVITRVGPEKFAKEKPCKK